MSDIHWLRLKVGIIYFIIATLIGILMSIFLFPFYSTAQAYPQYSVLIVILVFLIGAYVIGAIIIWIAFRYICGRG